MKRIQQHLDPFLIVTLVLCGFSLWPLLRQAGLPNGDDVLYHVYRAAEMDRAWANGVYLPRWAEAFYEGYGAPLFHYYASLTYYTTSVMTRLLGLDAVNSLRLVIALCMLGSGAGVYGFVRAYAGRAGGVLGALAYVYSPYILFTEPYARGTYPELMAFALFPVVMWAYSRVIRRGDTLSVGCAALGSGLLIITHNLMALVLTALLAGWLGFGGMSSVLVKRAALRRYGLGVMAVGLGVGLAAYFWLPVMREGDAVKLNNLIGVAQLDYRNFFVPTYDLFAHSPRLDAGAFNGLEAQLNLGVAQWVLALAGVLGVVGVWLWRRDGLAEGAVVQTAFFGLASAAIIFLMLPAASGLWDVLPPLAFLQFPWRFLGPAAFCLAVLVGMNGVWLQRLGGRWAAGVSGGLVVMIIGLASLLLFVPEWIHATVDTSVQAYHEAELQGLQRATTFSNEYLPAAVAVEPGATPRLLADYADGYPINKAHVEALPEGVRVTVEAHGPQEDVWLVDAPEAFQMEVLTYDWLGWAAEVDGEPVTITASQPHGLITFPVEAGEHRVRVYLGSTPARDSGNLITLVSAGVWLGVVVMLRGRGTNAPAAVKRDGGLLVGLSVGGAVALVFLAVYLREGGAWVNSPPGEARLAQVQTDYRLGEQIRLIGYSVNGARFRAGDTVELVVYWYTTGAIPYGYNSFVHISTGGPPAAQADKLNPAGLPTKTWPSSGFIHDDYSIRLPADMPAGEYAVMVGLYTCDTQPAGACGNGERLVVTDGTGATLGDAVRLMTIEVGG